MVIFSQADHEKALAAIRTAEAKTSGQIVCVIARSASSYMEPVLLWAILGALLSPFLCMLLTQWSVTRIFEIQILVFLGLCFILSLPSIRMRLVPSIIKRRLAHRLAMEQFYARGVTHTRDRIGVMIFVSLAEHYVRIIADTGINQSVNEAQWQAIINKFIGYIHKDAFTDGLILSIEECGTLLARTAPPNGSGNILPDRVYVI